MKIQAIVVMAAALCVPNAFSQRGPTRVAAPPQRSTFVPMGNPIAPMRNPVQPIIQSPFLPHPATTPTFGRGGAFYGRRAPVFVGAPYYAPYYDYSYFHTSTTIPGLPPGARYEDYIDPRTAYSEAGSSPTPYSPPEPAPSNTPVYYPEPRWIIREPQPNRVVQPPAAGALRSDVILQLGQPWGTFSTRGIETLYFDGLTVVFGIDGRVTSTR